MNTLTVTTVHLLFALGAVAVYLALPGGRRSAGRAGLILGLAALVGFVLLAAERLFPKNAQAIAFGVLAIVALFAAARVITHRRPVYSAMYFLLVVLAVACLMVLQAAEFLGIALVIVYAGAILVTYVFVIMLAQPAGEPAVDRRAREPFMAVLAGFLTTAAIGGVAVQGGFASASDGAGAPATETVLVAEAAETPEPAPTPRQESLSLEMSNTAQVGFQLLSQYVVALEIAGVLLLVAMIGAIALARKRVPCDVPVAPEAPVGELGKQVPPF